MTIRAVGFVGIDELCLEMASSLLNSGFRVHGFEESQSFIDGFTNIGGYICPTPEDVGRGVEALIVSAWNYDHICDLLFGIGGSTKGLSSDAIIVLRSDILPNHAQKLEKQLKEAGFSFFIDALVWKANSQEQHGEVIISISGRNVAIEKAQTILSGITEKLYAFEGEVGTARKVMMVNLLLEGIHLVAASEALFLGSQAGINSWILYNILSNAAGSSWIFVNRVPQMIRGEFGANRSLNALIQDLGSIRDMAKSLIFPLPLLAVAHEQLIYGSLCGCGEKADANFVKAWEKTGISIASSGETYSPENLGHQIVDSSSTVKKIGFIGLGAMGFGMATQLLKCNFAVCGYDLYKPTLARFSAAGGLVGGSPAEASKDAEVLIVMVTNENQAESVLFGEYGSVTALAFGASIILSSTVSPEFVTNLEARLHGEQKNLRLVDAPVSGGVQRAANGTLTIMAAGTDEALKSSGSVLSAMSEKLYVIKGGAGAASCVKMVNQLLAGVHIASAAEAMAFGARLGLNTRTLFEVIMSGGGSSWYFFRQTFYLE